MGCTRKVAFIQGDLLEVTIVILLWCIEKCLNQTNKKVIHEFILGGLIIYHNLTLVQKNWPIKKIANVFGNQWKVGNYAGYQN